METSTELTWMLLIFVLLLAFLNHGAIGDSPLVWGSAMILMVPFDIFSAVSNGAPLVAPLAVLALLFYLQKLLPGAVGEGFTTFIIASVIIVLTGL